VDRHRQRYNHFTRTRIHLDGQTLPLLRRHNLCLCKGAFMSLPLSQNPSPGDTTGWPEAGAASANEGGLKPGDRLGSYELLALLGTHPRVFHARHVRLKKDAALIGWLDISGEAKAADPNGQHWAVLLRSRGDPVWVRLGGSGPGGARNEDDSQLPGELRTALQSARGDRPGLHGQLCSFQ
jgi:hypothetical protein